MSMSLSTEILPGETASGESAKGLSERSIVTVLRAVRRRKLLAGGIVAAFLIGSLVLANSLPQTYTASALLVISANKPSVTNFDNLAAQNPPPDPMLVRSELNVLESRAIAGRVVDRLNLLADPEFNPLLGSRPLLPFSRDLQAVWTWFVNTLKTGHGQPLVTPGADTDPNSPTARELTVSRVMRSLAAENDGRSYSIDVSFTSRSPAKAAAIANAFAEEYIQSQIDAKAAATQRAYDWLKSRVAGLRQEVQDADRDIQQFRDQHNLARVEPNGTSEASQQLQEMTTQLITAEAAGAAAESKLNRAREQLRNNAGASIPEVLGSPLIQYLKQEQAALSRRVAELSETYGDNYPLLKNARAQLGDINQKIKAETERVISGLADEAQSSQLRVNALRTQLQQYQSNLLASDRVHVQLQELESAAEAKRTLLKMLSERLEQTSAVRNMVQADAQIIGRADPPPLPSGPNKIAIVGLAVLGSCIIVGFVVYLLERFDPGFRTALQVEGAIGLPCVAMVPTLGGRMLPNGHITSRRIARSRSMFAEAIRMARGAVLHTEGKDAARIIAVTSSVPEEGKSVFAAAFARSLVEVGRSVLLVDCDLRRPRIGELMGVNGGPGLRDVIARRVAGEEAIRKEGDGRLDILPAGQPTGGEEDALEPERLWRFLADCRNFYDTIVVDTPPVMVVADASVVARIADSVIYVVHWARTPRETVMAGIRKLRGVSDAAVKLVLSKVDLAEHAKYRFKDEGYYASMYESYYSGSTGPARRIAGAG